MFKLTFMLLIAGSVVAAHAQPLQREPQVPPPAAASTPDDYVIGAEDVLGIVFWREPEMSGDVTVRPDGNITLPVIGEMLARGLTPAALQLAIENASKKYLTEPKVTVIVRAINSRKIFVTGRVTTPGAHPLVGTLTVLQAIALAGGLNEYANSKKIVVLRTEAGRTITLNFNYKDVSQGRNLQQNVPLKPGDTVVVP